MSEIQAMTRGLQISDPGGFCNDAPDEPRPVSGLTGSSSQRALAHFDVPELESLL